MSIRFTLIGLLTVLTAIVAHASYTSLRFLGENNKIVHDVSEHIIPSLAIIAALTRDIGRFRALEAEHILISYPEEMARKEMALVETQTSIDDYMIKIRNLDKPEQEIREWDAVAATWKRYRELHSRLEKLTHENRDAEAVPLFDGEMGAIYDELSQILGPAVEREQLEATERMSSVVQQYESARSLLLAGLLLGLTVCCCATAYAVWGVSRPLSRLSRAMKRLAEDEVEVELPTFGRQNEIGQITEAVQRFKVRAADRAEALQKARKTAESAAAAKTNFIASMSHEIRTPLNGVLGMAQSLFADELRPEQRNKVSIILDSGSNLLALLNDVLDLSKIDAGKLEIVSVDGDLRSSLMGLVHLFQPGADDKGIALTATLDPTIPERLNFDPVRVRQCVSNVLSNAIKFTPSGGQIARHQRSSARRRQRMARPRRARG